MGNGWWWKMSGNMSNLHLPVRSGSFLFANAVPLYCCACPFHNQQQQQQQQKTNQQQKCKQQQQCESLNRWIAESRNLWISEWMKKKPSLGSNKISNSSRELLWYLIRKFYLHLQIISLWIEKKCFKCVGIWI